MGITLFICTGNICRSPLAASLWAAQGHSARSAGISAVNGLPMHPLAVKELERRNISVDGNFRSTRLIASLAHEAERIICMERAHRAAVLALAPQALRKTFTLSEYAQLKAAHPNESDTYLHRARRGIRDSDIKDPINGTIEDFRICADHIESLLEAIVGNS